MYDNKVLKVFKKMFTLETAGIIMKPRFEKFPEYWRGVKLVLCLIDFRNFNITWSVNFFNWQIENYLMGVKK